MKIFYQPVNLNQYDIFQQVKQCGHVEAFLATNEMKPGDLMLFHVGTQNIEKAKPGIYAYGEIVSHPYIYMDENDEYCYQKNSVDVKIFEIDYNKPLIEESDCKNIINSFRRRNKIDEKHYDFILNKIHNQYNTGVSWLITGDMSEYDIFGAFKKFGAIWWHLSNTNKNTSIGDIVYIYITKKKYKKIMIKCVVIDYSKSYHPSMDYDIEFRTKDSGDFNDNCAYMKLQMISIFDEERLSLPYIIEHSYKGVLMGPRKLDDRLADLRNYIEEVLNVEKVQLLCEDETVIIDELRMIRGRMWKKLSELLDKQDIFYGNPNNENTRNCFDVRLGKEYYYVVSFSSMKKHEFTVGLWINRKEYKKNEHPVYQWAINNLFKINNNEFIYKPVLKESNKSSQLKAIIHYDDLLDDIQLDYFAKKVLKEIQRVESILIEGMSETDDNLKESEAYLEGNMVEILTNQYERSQKAREKCIKKYGFICQVCNCNLTKVYGPIAEGFIHVHHINSLSSQKQEHEVDLDNLITVCPNCHSMLHRKYKGKEVTIEELKQMIENER